MAKLTKEEYIKLRTVYSETLSRFPDLDSQYLDEILETIDNFNLSLDDKLAGDE